MNKNKLELITINMGEFIIMILFSYNYFLDINNTVASNFS